MLKHTTMKKLENDYYNLLVEGNLNEHASEIMQEIIRNNYEGEIWEIVDNNENYDFDSVLDYIMDTIGIEATEKFYIQGN